MKKNIYHILSDFKIGGVEVAARSSLEYLNKEYNFYIISFGKIEHDFLKAINVGYRNNIFQLNYKSLSLFKDFLKIYRQLKKNPPQVFLFSLWKASALSFILKMKYQKIVFITCIHSTKFFHSFDRYFSIKSVLSANYIFVDSMSTGKFISSYTNKNYRVISFFTKKILSKKKEFHGEKICFLYLGRMSKDKGIEQSIDLIYFLRENMMDVELHLYGRDDGYLKTMQQKIQKKGLGTYIHFMGPIDPNEVPTVLERYNFYLQLSEHEGMAISVCEAMQAGLVCLVRPVGEIAHYSKDLYSAIHYKDSFMQGKELLKILRNKDLLQKISATAPQTFSGVPLYKHSLAAAIQDIIDLKSQKRL
uniref:glycosyltransferase family 4 protein n=1 Tax=Candidatus Electronema sp. TaxID=2698783 RepID=UPI00405702C9